MSQAEALQFAKGKDRYDRIRQELLSMAEPDFAKFSSGLLRKPGEACLTGTAARMLGVRLPALRRLAKKLTKEDWSGYLEALAAQIEQNGCAGERMAGTDDRAVSFEEVMLWGFLIGSAKIEAGDAAMAEGFERIRQFVPHIDNWSLCDSFCASLKFAAAYRAETWEFLQGFLRSEEEYAVRFGIVMVINYFITEEYINRLFPVFDAIRHEGYYVRMAVAWAVSVCYVRFPEETQSYLDQNSLDDFTYNKALQKIAESRCVSCEVREQMRKRKRSGQRTLGV